MIEIRGDHAREIRKIKLKRPVFGVVGKCIQSVLNLVVKIKVVTKTNRCTPASRHDPPLFTSAIGQRKTKREREGRDKQAPL
jgi:hypothetical protein